MVRFTVCSSVTRVRFVCLVLVAPLACSLVSLVTEEATLVAGAACSGGAAEGA